MIWDSCSWSADRAACAHDVGLLLYPLLLYRLLLRLAPAVIPADDGAMWLRVDSIMWFPTGNGMQHIVVVCADHAANCPWCGCSHDVGLRSVSSGDVDVWSEEMHSCNFWHSLIWCTPAILCRVGRCLRGDGVTSCSTGGFHIVVS